MAQVGEIRKEEARETLAARVARHRQAARRAAEAGFRHRYLKLQGSLQEAVVLARESGALRVGQALACASAALAQVARADSDPALFHRAFARLSNFLRAADSLARHTGRRRPIAAIRAGLAAAFSLGWWWRVSVLRGSPQTAILWLAGTRHSLA